MTENQDFDMFHPDFSDWCDQVDWSTGGDYCNDCGNYRLTGTVITELLRLGFTITAPPMPRYTVLYNGNPVTRTDSKEEADRILARMENRAGWAIRDREGDKK